jgi:ABC-2 type transport system permease protein
MMLLAGVIVPISLLPEWVQPFSRIVFLYWSADLLRDAVAAEPVDNVLPRLAALTGLGVAGTLLGAWMVDRMLDHHKREGTLGLS